MKVGTKILLLGGCGHLKRYNNQVGIVYDITQTYYSDFRVSILPEYKNIWFHFFEDNHKNTLLKYKLFYRERNLKYLNELFDIKNIPLSVRFKQVKKHKL